MASLIAFGPPVDAGGADALPSPGETPAINGERPEAVAEPQRDSASERLIANFLTATGGEAAHQRIEAIRVTGSMRLLRVDYQFELVETRDGRRWLRTLWRNYEDLGRIHERIVATDGTPAGTWQRQLAPRRRDAESFQGEEAEQFRELFWFMNPIHRDHFSNWSMEYRGRAQTLGRETFLVRAWLDEEESYWFYFDRETSLLIRHGGVGRMGSAEGVHELAAPAYRKVSDVHLPAQFRFLAQDSAFGSATVDRIEINPSLPADLFEIPQKPNEVWLRQVGRR